MQIVVNNIVNFCAPSPTPIFSPLPPLKNAAFPKVFNALAETDWKALPC